MLETLTDVLAPFDLTDAAPTHSKATNPIRPTITSWEVRSPRRP
jgi:hypothetical protein